MIEEKIFVDFLVIEIQSFSKGVFIGFIGHRSFTQGIQQSAEDSYPYIGRRRRRRRRKLFFWWLVLFKQNMHADERT